MSDFDEEYLRGLQREIDDLDKLNQENRKRRQKTLHKLDDKTLEKGLSYFDDEMLDDMIDYAVESEVYEFAARVKKIKDSRKQE